MPYTEFDHFRRSLASANSHPLASFLSFSEEAEAIGLGPDWSGMVAALEAEGSRLIGAAPCRSAHGRAVASHPDEAILDPVYASACPDCRAAL